jgi:hypothetical protein
MTLMVSTLTPQDEQELSDQEEIQEQSPSVEELQQQFELPALDPEKGKEKVSFFDGIKNSVRSRVDRVMGVLSPIPRTYHKVAGITSRISQGIKKVVNFLSWNSDTPTAQELQDQYDLPSHDSTDEQEAELKYTNKTEDVAKAYQIADKAEQEHMDDLADRFTLMQNNYRHNDLKMKNPIMQTSPHLMKEAAIIAKRQSAQGFMAHTSDEYRASRDIHGENLFSVSEGELDFSYAALKGLLASKKHKPSVVGTFTHVGCAIRSGIDEKSGKKLYFLVVLYGNGIPQNAPDIEISDQERQLKELEAKTLKEAVKDRPYLKAHFDALQAEVKNDPELSLEYNAQLTAQMQKKKALMGMFSVTLKKGDKIQNYSVYDRPPLLIRTEKTADREKSFQVEFHEVIQDFENMSNAPEITTEELSSSFEMESKKPVIKRPDNFGEKLEKIRLIKDQMPQEYAESVAQIKRMSQGEDLDGLREKHYEGWKDEHFEDLLEILK